MTRQLDDQGRQQRDRLASTLATLGDDLSQMAERSEGSGLAVHVAREAAERTRALQGYLEDREPRDLLDDARDFARRRPGVFLAGALVAGVVAGRVLRGAKDAPSTAPSTGTVGSTTPTTGTTTAPTAPTPVVPAPPVSPVPPAGPPAGAPTGYPTGSPTGAPTGSPAGGPPPVDPEVPPLPPLPGQGGPTASIADTDALGDQGPMGSRAAGYGHVPHEGEGTR